MPPTGGSTSARDTVLVFPLHASPALRKRTSTALHALAAETPTAKAKAHGHTGIGEAGP
jgi:hypothetical protein